MVVFGKDGDGVPVEEDLAAVVAELTDADQVVLECGHDLAALDGKIGQVEVGGSGGGVDAAGGVADVGCGSVRVDVAYWGSGSDVYVTCTCVGDGRVGDGNSRRGGAKARKRS